jgi:hypothetical protein
VINISLKSTIECVFRLTHSAKSLLLIQLARSVSQALLLERGDSVLGTLEDALTLIGERALAVDANRAT